MGIATVAIYSECDRAALARADGGRGVAGRAQSATRELSADRSRRRCRAEIGRRCRPSGLRLPRRERRLRGRVPGCGAHLHRTDARSHHRDGEQDGRAPGGDASGRAGRAGHRAAARRGRAGRRGAADRGLDWLSADAQGGRRRRRQGHAQCGGARGTVERVTRRAIRSGVGVRRLGRLSRAAHPAATAHRSSAPRRSARHRPPVRRTRVFAAAPPSESRRGESLDGRAREDAPGAGGGGGRAWRARSTTPTPARSSS